MEGLLKEMHRLRHEVSEQSQVVETQTFLLVEGFNGFQGGAFGFCFFKRRVFIGPNFFWEKWMLFLPQDFWIASGRVGFDKMNLNLESQIWNA